MPKPSPKGNDKEKSSPKRKGKAAKSPKKRSPYALGVGAVLALVGGAGAKRKYDAMSEEQKNSLAGKVNKHLNQIRWALGKQERAKK